MKRFCISFIALGSFLVLNAAGGSWSGTVMDVMCVHQVPAAHRRACALSCAASGFAIVTADGKVYKLDSAGNKKALALLKASTKETDLRAKVTGELNDGLIHVGAIELE